MLQNEASTVFDKQYPYLRAINVNWGKVDSENLPQMWANSCDISKYQILNGDLLVCEGGEVGRAAIANNINETTIIQNALHRVRSIYSSVNYLAYFLEHTANCGWFGILCNKATIAHFTVEKFSSLLMPLPPLPIQKDIAAYLDKETVRIDALIAKKERQIALLQEKRQAIITRAITKGLDPKAKMKDSGVEWIGEIPEGWEVIPIKHLGKMQNGYAFDSLEFMDSGVRILKISNIQSMRIDWEDESFIDEKYYTLLSQFRVYKNDLIFALTRPIISTGIKAAVFESDEKALLNQRNAVFRPSGKADMKWIYYIVIDSVFTHIFDMEIDKTGQQPNISTNKIGNIKIPFPPKKEQNIIIEYLDTVCNEINGLSRLIQKSVITLREYRSSLITTAVSGQIDISSERKQSNNRGSA